LRQYRHKDSEAKNFVTEKANLPNEPFLKQTDDKGFFLFSVKIKNIYEYLRSRTQRIKHVKKHEARKSHCGVSCSYLAILHRDLENPQSAADNDGGRQHNIDHQVSGQDLLFGMSRRFF
jgi:hypothetical protein